MNWNQHHANGAHFLFVSLRSWDEWVPENRVLKYNEANIQKQRELAKQHETLAAKNKKGFYFSINFIYLFIFIGCLQFGMVTDLFWKRFNLIVEIVGSGKNYNIFDENGWQCRASERQTHTTQYKNDMLNITHNRYKSVSPVSGRKKDFFSNT